jgi:hypothetical protein
LDVEGVSTVRSGEHSDGIRRMSGRVRLRGERRLADSSWFSGIE